MNAKSENFLKSFILKMREQKTIILMFLEPFHTFFQLVIISPIQFLLFCFDALSVLLWSFSQGLSAFYKTMLHYLSELHSVLLVKFVASHFFS